MTAAELYDADPALAGFLHTWDEDRRCPLELVDWFLDRDMPDQAERARWAATAPDRPVYCPYTDCGERDTPCGVYPCMTGGTVDKQGDVAAFFWGAAYGDNRACAHRLVGPCQDCWLPDPGTLSSQLLWLLDHYHLPAEVACDGARAVPV